METRKKKVGIIGYGFVGRAVSQLRETYDVEIYDPYIEEYKNNLSAYSADYVFVCVPTPTGKGGVDIGAVEQAAVKWRKIKNKSSILVIKSTIPIGTVEMLSEKLNTNKILHNPEFLTQRTAMEDFRSPIEVIVGGEETASESLMKLYRGYYLSLHSKPTYITTTSRIAETIKTVRNSFYATKVSFFNEIYELCDKIQINYEEFRDIFTLNGEHPWIAEQHTHVPGPDGSLGFGGACLPKDSEGLVATAKEYEVFLEVLDAAVRSNKKKRDK